jgi:hypothetical protein
MRCENATINVLGVSPKKFQLLEPSISPYVTWISVGTMGQARGGKRLFVTMIRATRFLQLGLLASMRVSQMRMELSEPHVYRVWDLLLMDLLEKTENLNAISPN